jgi:hypothetical protein
MAHGLGFLSGLGVIAMVLLRCREFIPAFSLTVAVMALVSFLPGPIPSDHLLLYSGHEFVFNLITLVVNPGESFSAVSFWPKSTIALLLLGVLALRWNDAVAAAYGLMIVMAVYHIGLAVTLFLIFVGIDLVFRSRKLLTWQVILTTGILATLMILNGIIWFVAETVTPLQITLIILAIFFILYLLRRFIAPLAARYPIRVTDIATMISALAIAFPIVIFGYLASAPEGPWGPNSIWVQMLSRVIVCTATATLFALAVNGWDWLKRKLGPADGLRTLVVTLSVVSLMSVYGATGAWWMDGRKIVSSINDLDRTRTKPNLAQIYFNVVRSLDIPELSVDKNRPGNVRPARGAGSNK